MRFLLGAQRWTVEVTPADTWTGNESGECFPQKCLIKIRQAHIDVMRDTLLHEVLHAILAVQGITLDNDLEEEVVRALAPALDSILSWKIRGLK